MTKLNINKYYILCTELKLHLHLQTDPRPARKQCGMQRLHGERYRLRISGHVSPGLFLEAGRMCDRHSTVPRSLHVNDRAHVT